MSKNDWKLYEQQIYNKFSSEFSECEIIKNDYILGQFSKVNRQVDVSIKGMFAGHKILGVVECKCFNKKVDVKIIDSFIGFLEDVNANVGVIITTKGFSKAANNRAKVKNIRLDIVDFNYLDDYEFSIDLCSICQESLNEYQMPGEIVWNSYFSKPNKSEDFEIGSCDRCNSIHVKCRECNTITPVYESDYDIEKECDGGCGQKFKIINEHIGKGMYEQKLELI